MRTLTALLAGVFALALSLGTAVAQDFSGTYVSTSGPEVLTYKLTQSGKDLNGDISGSFNGTLQGTVEGNAVSGLVMLEVPDNTTVMIEFNGTQSANGDIPLQIKGPGGSDSITLVRQGGGLNTGNNDTPQPPMADVMYYYAVGSQQQGPVTLDALKGLAADGTIASDSLVFKQGTPDWAAAETFPELAEAFAPAPAPAPTPPPLTPADDYYVLDANNQQVGPLTLEAIIDRIAAGETAGDDYIWKTGIPDWVEASTLPELADAFQPAPPPRPTPPPPPKVDTPPAPPPITPAADEPTPPPMDSEADEPTPAPAATDDTGEVGPNGWPVITFAN